MISAIVPTFRGQERLERNLASVIDSLAATGDAWEIVVVDDGGGALGALPAGARVLSRVENRGYGPAVNAGVADSRGEWLLILNDDVRLERACVSVLSRALVEPSLFAATPGIRSPLAACGDEGGHRGVFRAGLLELDERPPAGQAPTLYAVGCCYLCPRALFEDLGGYDDVFAPFFWEDVDLGYRAWRRGLRILHVPEAVCHHEGSATLRQRPLAERAQAELRSRALFHLRNLQEPALRARSLGALLAIALLDPSPARQAGLAEALARFGASGARGRGGLSDSEILARAAGA